MSPCRLLIVFGTRPELIKLQSVFSALRNAPIPAHQIHLAFTSQHPDLVDAVDLDAYGFPLHVLPSPMAHEQSLNLLLSKMLAALDTLLDALSPGLVLVQGDTTSTLAGALAAFHRGVPVAHLEAGLRTPDLRSPFPEEANRRMISTLATHHYAPTAPSRDNLLAMGISPKAILVTGNTSIDRLHAIRAQLTTDSARPPEATPQVLLTLHRRENMERLEPLLEALARVLLARPHIHVMWPRHPNPRIASLSEQILGALPNVTLGPALTHLECVAAMQRSALVITDSGGLQEEAVTLGVPVVVMRSHTDRPEALSHGLARLASGSVQEVMQVVARALDEPFTVDAASSLYGDGKAGERVVHHLIEQLC